MQLLKYSALLSFCLLMLACGNKEKEESTAGTGESNSPKGMMESLTEAQNQLQKMSEGKSVDPINFRELQKVLPEKAGRYEKVDFSGSTSGTMGFNVSVAKAEYSGPDDARIEVDLTDAGGLGQATMAFAAWSMATIDQEDSRGYERTGQFKGYKSYEKYEKSLNRSEVSLFIENRLILVARGKNIDVDGLKDFLSKLDLSKFKSLI